MRKDGKGRSKEECEFLQASIYLSLSKGSFVRIIPELILPSAYSKQTIAFSFPLQIKDQSLNIFFSLYTRL